MHRPASARTGFGTETAGESGCVTAPSVLSPVGCARSVDDSEREGGEGKRERTGAHGRRYRTRARARAEATGRSADTQPVMAAALVRAAFVTASAAGSIWLGVCDSGGHA